MCDDQATTCRTTLSQDVVLTAVLLEFSGDACSPSGTAINIMSGDKATINRHGLVKGIHAIIIH